MQFQRLPLYFCLVFFIYACAEDEATSNLNPVYNTKEDQSVVVIPLQGNDRLNREIFTMDPPQNGTLKNQGDGSYLYVPKPNYSGQENISFILKDGDTGQVQINIEAVNDPPIARDDFFSATQSNPVQSVAIPVLQNDKDVEDASLSIVAVEQPSSTIGAVTVNGSELTFTPTISFTGSVQFSYSVSDGNLISQAKVNLFIIPANESITSINIMRGTLTPTIISLQEGVSVRLRAVATLQSGAQVDVSNRVSWTSQNQAIAQIDDNENKGRLLARSVGTTQIKVALGNSFEVSKPVRVLAPPPVAPANLSASLDRANKKVVVNWPEVSGADYYNLYVVSGGRRVVFSGVTPPYDHTEILNANTYYYVIHSVRNSVEGAGSKEVSLTVFIDRPNPPDYIRATSVNNQIDLQWSPVVGAESYNIYWSTSLPVPMEPGNQFNATGTNYSHSPVSVATTYYYVITANREGQESLPSIVHSALVRPDAVNNLQAMGHHENIMLSWNAALSAEHYYVYYSQSQPIPLTANNRFLVSGQTSYLHEGLNNGDEWFYAVTGVNSGGESDSTELNETVGVHIETALEDANFQQCLNERNNQNLIYAHQIVGSFSCSSRGVVSIEGLQYLSQLRSLSISGNQISDLSLFSRWSFSNIQNLTLQNNQLTETTYLGNLENLRNLDISFNALTDNLSGISGLRNLETLIARSATLQNLEALTDIASLVEVRVASNDISDLQPLSDKAGLRTLALSRNQIENISPLASLSLINLQLDRNFIMNISSLNNVFSIQAPSVFFRIDENFITDLSPVNNSQITSLYMGDNWIFPHVVSALANTNKYYFFITAVDSNGQEGPRSNIAIAQPRVLSTVPEAPKRIFVQANGGLHNIKWTPIRGVNEYKVYWSDSENFNLTDPTTSSVTVNPITSRLRRPEYTQPTALVESQPYYYAVTSVDGNGTESQKSDEALIFHEVTTTIAGRIAPPTNLSTLALDGSVGLRWDSVVGAASYNLYFATSQAELLAKYDSANNIPLVAPDVADIGNSFQNINLPLVNLLAGSNFDIQKIINLRDIGRITSLVDLNIWRSGVTNLQPLYNLNQLNILGLSFNNELLCADIDAYNLANPTVSVNLDDQPVNNVNGVDDPTVAGSNCVQP